jgi:hypothetical protein
MFHAPASPDHARMHHETTTPGAAGADRAQIITLGTLPYMSGPVNMETTRVT